MKRITAAKRIKAHLRDYRKEIDKDKAAQLSSYSVHACPLCFASKCEGRINCDDCLRWPGRRDNNCFGFKDQVNDLKTVPAKLRWIDKLEAELDRWASEVTS